jgi:hypothetical protein
VPIGGVADLFLALAQFAANKAKMQETGVTSPPTVYVADVA